MTFPSSFSFSSSQPPLFLPPGWSLPASSSLHYYHLSPHLLCWFYLLILLLSSFLFVSFSLFLFLFPIPCFSLPYYFLFFTSPPAPSSSSFSLCSFWFSLLPFPILFRHSCSGLSSSHLFFLYILSSFFFLSHIMISFFHVRFSFDFFILERQSLLFCLLSIYITKVKRVWDFCELQSLGVCVW